LDRGVRSGKLSQADRDAAVARLRFTTDLGDFSDRQLTVEAVAENEQVKTEIFSALDKVVEAPDAIFTSNTSSIPIMKLGMATTRPDQVVGVHFFNPVPVLKLVELVPSLLTGADTQARAEAFVTGQLGKQVVRSQDRAGFVVNALLVP
nr:3-hydroxyacyl-CoA dehydrogenase NAD-binding domain-containing protein [Micromonospora sp. DSM 115978]